MERGTVSFAAGVPVSVSVTSKTPVSSRSPSKQSVTSTTSPLNKKSVSLSTAGKNGGDRMEETFFQTAVPGMGVDGMGDDEGDNDNVDDVEGGDKPVLPLYQRTRSVVSMTDFDPSEVKLPITINIVAVRETLFADAPFISKNNKAFWRRMVCSKQFGMILAAAYNFITGCISDSGAVLMDKLNNIQQSPLVGMIAANMSEIFFSFKRHDRDILLSKLPEVVHFMILQSLQTALPRHHRLYSSGRFRELVVDWCTELIWGIRTTNCRAHREWLFHDATEIHILTLNNNNSNNNNNNNGGSGTQNNTGRNGGGTTHRGGLTQRGGKSPYDPPTSHHAPIPPKMPLSQATSSFSIAHSPLVQMYMDMNKSDEALAKGPGKNFLALDVRLSHMPDRPLFSMEGTGSGVVKLGKPREKMVDSSALKQYLHEAAKTVRTIHHAHADITAHATQGLREVRAARMDQMKTIDKALLEELKQHRLAARREQKKSPYEAMERVMAAAHREERQREEWEEKKSWGEERRGTGDRAGLGLGPEDTGGSEGAGSVSHSQSRNSVGMVSVMTSEADDGGDEDD